VDVADGARDGEFAFAFAAVVGDTAAHVKAEATAASFDIGSVAVRRRAIPAVISRSMRVSARS
jgi:hypothetical protein